MRILFIAICILYIPQMAMAQAEVPFRVAMNNVEKTTKKADRLLEKADEAFDNEDFDKAYRYYVKAAKAGNIDAYYNVGMCFENGWGVKTDSKKALEWYRKSAYSSVALGQYKLGILYFNGLCGLESDRKKGLEWLFKAANGCEPWAMEFIGNCYRNGNGVEKNLEEAIRWYRMAAEYGDEDAMRHLQDLNVPQQEKESETTVVAKEQNNATYN